MTDMLAEMKAEREKLIILDLLRTDPSIHDVAVIVHKLSRALDVVIELLEGSGPGLDAKQVAETLAAAQAKWEGK